MTELSTEGRLIYNDLLNQPYVPISILRRFENVHSSGPYTNLISELDMGALRPLHSRNEQPAVQIEREQLQPRVSQQQKNKRRISTAGGVPDKKTVGTTREEVSERKKCDHCEQMLDSYVSLFIHTLKKHRGHAYKLITDDIVCSIEYCDYVGISKKSKTVHEIRSHGKNPAKQEDIISEIDSGKCIYCEETINTVVYCKQHMLKCGKRDERAMLGCSSCDKKFHFLWDYIHYHKDLGGVDHGKPVLLNDE